MGKKRKIGVFGGGFDPIHFGHIYLAIQMQEIHNLDEILFIPAYCSPHKLSKPPMASGKHRLKMTALAIQGIPGFSVCDYEIKKASPSYTIDTLHMLKKSRKWGKCQLHLILAEDVLPAFSRWKEPEEILQLAPPLIGGRPGFNTQKGKKISKKFLQVFEKGFTNTKIMEISSTDVRERLKKGEYCGHLVNDKVLDYIFKYKLY